MFSIFKKAREVIVWLGEHDSNTKSTALGLQRLTQEVSSQEKKCEQALLSGGEAHERIHWDDQPSNNPGRCASNTVGVCYKDIGTCLKCHGYTESGASRRSGLLMS